jgi:hypothetical protein
MPSSPSSSSNTPPNLLQPWWLWLFCPPSDPAYLGGGLVFQSQPNPPPAQIITPPAPAFPLAIQTHVGQFLTDVQYANLVNLHIFTQAQHDHDILLSELSNAQLDYLLSHHVITDEQLAYQLNNNLLTINQITRISRARLFDMLIEGRNIGINNVFIGLPNNLSRLNISSELSRCFSVEDTVVSNVSQKALLLHLNFMDALIAGQFVRGLSDEELSTLIINDAITLPQLNYLNIVRLAELELEAQAVIHIINMETNYIYKGFINQLIYANTRATLYEGVYIFSGRAKQILTAFLVRIVESKEWDYYQSEGWATAGFLLPEVLSALDSRGNYLLTAVYLNKPQKLTDLLYWDKFMRRMVASDVLNFVSLEAYTQWLNMVVNTNNQHALFNINVLSNERFSLINKSYFLYERPMETFLELDGPMHLDTYGFISLVNTLNTYIVPLHYEDLYSSFSKMAALSRGRRDILREVFKKLDLDKKALFLVCTQYNPSTDEGLSIDSGGAGSSGGRRPRQQQ